jgi:nondiscriminating aspartyl-tRNA synthetase
MGWVGSLRMQRKMQFLILRDPSGSVQVTHRRGGQEDGLEAILEGLTAESAVAVSGRVVLNSVVKLAGLEIVPESIEVFSRAEAQLPIDRMSGAEHRLDWRFLDVRLRPEQRLVFEVQNTIETAMREYVRARDFTEMHTPKLMGTASESGSEVFAVKYFDRKAFLAQSPQFFKQMAIASGIERVFEIGPVFRAEPSFTSRHSTEFTGVDVEMAWQNVDDIMSMEEDLLAQVIERVRTDHGEAIEDLLGVKLQVPLIPFPRIPMREALTILREAAWDPEHEREDLDPQGERLLAELAHERYKHDFVFVTRFPSSVRPFYHMRPVDEPDQTLSFDLLYRGLEITTGAQREHRHDVLIQQALEKGVDLEPMSDYLNMFRFGTPPHGGFGLGLARLVMVMLHLDSIRDATFLFRGPNRLTP